MSVIEAAKRFVSIAGDEEEARGTHMWHVLMEEAYQNLKKAIEAEEERRGS
jgi:hypothetical protein